MQRTKGLQSVEALTKNRDQIVSKNVAGMLDNFRILVPSYTSATSTERVDNINVAESTQSPSPNSKPIGVGGYGPGCRRSICHRLHIALGTLVLKWKVFRDGAHTAKRVYLITIITAELKTFCRVGI